MTEAKIKIVDEANNEIIMKTAFADLMKTQVDMEYQYKSMEGFPKFFQIQKRML